MNNHRVPTLLLILVLAWGSYLRFANLGLNTLASDEMNHYFVGQALKTSGEPVLPSGTRYTRGLEYSNLVAATLPRFGQMEVAVRFPSAVIGTLCLIAFALIGWSMAGPWAAVFASTLLAIYPEALRLSRFGRFYTLQLLAGLIAFYTGWRLLRDPLTADGFNRRRLLRDWSWALLTIAAFGYAASVQLTTFSVAAGFCLFLAVIGARDLRLHGRAAWRWSVPWQLTVIGLTVAGAMLAVRFDIVLGFLQEARTMPMWARLSDQGPGSISTYYRILSSHFPLIVSLSPLIFVVAIVRNPQLGGFLTAWFAVPILLHSFVFPWKSERYVLLAVPALFLAAGIAAVAGADALHRYLSRVLERLASPIKPGTAASLITSFVVVAALVTTPAFNTARRAVHAERSYGWAESVAILKKHPELAALPIGSAQPLVALHYWGRLDFTVQRALLESWVRDSTTGGFDNPYRMKVMGSPDVYAGRPTLTTPEAIRSRFAGRPGVLIGIDRKYVTFRNIEPSLREILEREGREICEGHCGSMLLYHWSFGKTPPDSLNVSPTTASESP